MKTWIISDTHFNHDVIKRSDFEWRPDNYNELIRTNWRKLVQPEDTIIHLWDVIFSRAWELKEILSELPWTKILVRGNHDKNKHWWYLDKGFNLVVDKLELNVGDKIVTLTHEPIRVRHNEYNIHWHLHTKGHRDEEYKKVRTWRHILYACELQKYKPIRLDLIINKLWHN